ncbi:family 1 encapsulin nanocompartment shell protein, partial [Nonomuraea sp. NPDC049784]|uniref:family 1 encapsulin nanocompartment shell protein n=1 Tax=Nonomuraea sp. NPDC049784 TaxID=3154361 RepID=UPI003400CBBD
VDVVGPRGAELSGVGTGHLQAIDPPADGVIAHARRDQPIVELRVPFTVDRQQVDSVERGAKDADWQPVKDAARRLAVAEDRAIFHGYTQAGITGIRAGSSNPAVTLPAHVRDYPGAISKAVTALRLAGVEGPYTLALGADAYTAVSGTTDEGYPILDHIARLIDGEIIWAPAIDGAFLLSTRGGDFELHIGQDISIGYLAHDTTSVELYFQETLTFLVYTGEAAVTLPAT